MNHTCSLVGADHVARPAGRWCRQSLFSSACSTASSAPPEICSCASSRREIWTGTSSRAAGGRSMRVSLGDVGRHGDAMPPSSLDALGEQVHQLQLLLGVLVEQQVQLVERRPDDLPVVLLVHVVEGDRVGQHLVQQFARSLRGLPHRGRPAGGAAVP